MLIATLGSLAIMFLGVGLMGLVGEKLLLIVDELFSFVEYLVNENK